MTSREIRSAKYVSLSIAVHGSLADSHRLSTDLHSQRDVGQCFFLPFVQLGKDCNDQLRCISALSLFVGNLCHAFTSSVPTVTAYDL